MLLIPDLLRNGIRIIGWDRGNDGSGNAEIDFFHCVASQLCHDFESV